MSSSGMKDFVYVSIAKHPFEEHGISVKNCADNEERLISFCCTIWFMISEKKYHKVHISSPWCMQEVPKVSTKHTKFFQPLNYTFMWTSDFYWYEHYTLTEAGGRSFKTFLKENYAIAVDSCYLFTNKC